MRHWRSALVGFGAVGVAIAFMLVGGCSSFTTAAPSDDRDAAGDAAPSVVSDADPADPAELDGARNDAAAATAIAAAIDGERLNDCAQWTVHGSTSFVGSPSPTVPYPSACRLCRTAGAAVSYVSISLPSAPGQYTISAAMRAPVSSGQAMCGIGFKKDDSFAGGSQRQVTTEWESGSVPTSPSGSVATSTIATLEVDDPTQVCCDFAAIAIEYTP